MFIKHLMTEKLKIFDRRLATETDSRRRSLTLPCGTMGQNQPTHYSDNNSGNQPTNQPTDFLMLALVASALNKTHESYISFYVI